MTITANATTIVVAEITGSTGVGRSVEGTTGSGTDFSLAVLTGPSAPNVSDVTTIGTATKA